MTWRKPIKNYKNQKENYAEYRNKIEKVFENWIHMKTLKEIHRND